MIPQLNKLLNGVVEHGSLFPEIPDFPWRVCSVRTEHREKCAHLQPSGVKLTVSLVLHTLIIFSLPEPFRLRICITSTAAILPFICHSEKCSDIQSPVRITA